MAQNKKQEIVVRIYLGFLFICLLGIAIVGRTFYLQAFQGNYYRSLADSLTIFPKKVQAERGNIYSADGRLLATTLPTFDVVIDFKTTRRHSDIFKENIDSVVLLLGAMYPEKSAQQYKAELWKAYKKKKPYYLLKRNATYVQYNAMKQWPLFREGQYKSGMIGVQNDKRLMPFGYLAQRTIGFTNKTGKQVGLEGSFNKDLQGVQGQLMVQKIAGGIVVPLNAAESISPQPGKDIYTTIDISLQDVAEDALHRALKHHNAEHGCVVLIESHTGKIKAIANLGRMNDSSYAEIQNYAVGEATEPGSTFKLATVAALMEDGFVTNNTSVEVGNGSAKFGDREIKDHDAPETPYLTLKRAIEVSSNVAIAKLAQQHYAANKQKLHQHLTQFGFNTAVKIELPGAGKTRFADYKKWSATTIPYLAHGYEICITPMHTLMFYNAIANGGKLIQPYIVEKVKEYNTTVDSTKTVVINEQLLKPSTVRQLREMLEAVVLTGTATNLKTDYLKVAGKTGTAKIADGAKGYAARKYQASFCGYFPAEDPQYTMIVVINSPSANGYYGNVVAGSIFKEVADKVYSLSLHMHKPVQQLYAGGKKLPLIEKGTGSDMEKIYAFLGTKVEDVSDWVALSSNSTGLAATEIDHDINVVPDVTGMSLKDAIYLLETQGLKVQITGHGTVRRQSLRPGEKISKGLSIALELN
jgi:cell division protein FtsI (penicillin-binding protein 3)